MLKVRYLEKGQEYDYKRIDHERNIIALSYFKTGSLYYFRVNEFNHIVIAEEEIIEVEEV